jgi:cobalt-zinc-cadmium efflux system protein
MHSHAHSHPLGGHDHRGHGHTHAPVDFGRAFAIGVALNLAYVAIEATAGLWYESMALLADAGHNLSDVAGLLIAWGGTFIILLQSSLFLRLLGEKGVNALERLMGLILVMMATQMFLDGIRAWMKG